MIARRQFVAGLGAAIVLGFNPSSRTWISTASAASSPFDHVPPLDGVLLTDAADRAADASDVGNIVHETPMAVLRPGSVDDIQKMVRFCRRLGISVSGRGQGHTTFGQSQNSGGLVIEISTLNKIHSVQPTFADLDAGVLWLDLLNQIVPQGLTPPALTGFTGLTIAGVLAVGGISSSYQTGAIIDYVRELEVVTGDGEVQRCSPSQNRALFDAVLGGLGQFGIVTRAVIDLVPAPRLVRVYSALYPDSATFFRDLRTVLGRGELEEAYNIGVPNGSGGFAYGFTMAKYFDPSNPPDNDHLLRGLSVAPSAFQAQDVPYLLYLLRVDAAVNQFKALGLWEGVLHPWFDVFLPEGTVEPYVSRVTASLQSDDVGSTGFLLLFPKKRSMLKRPFFRVPDGGEFVYLFDILTANDAPGPDPAFQSRMLARNRRLFEEARLAGGTRYSIGSIQFNHLDWILQYGLTWPAFAELKRVYDPSNILTPGPGIF